MNSLQEVDIFKTKFEIGFVKYLLKKSIINTIT